MGLKASQNAINLIKQFEGIRLTAYKDAVGVLTIGYGTTSGVYAGQTITQLQAERFLKNDLVKFEAKVNKYYDKYKWTQNEFDGLLTFCYNIGNIDGLTDNGKRSKEVIANKILEYNKAGGRVLSGLTSRRQAERNLFVKDGLEEVATTTQPQSSSSATYSKEQFIGDVQSIIGTTVDGIAGNQTLSKTVTISKKVNNKHKLVTPLQKYLKLLGYYNGGIDGIAGTQFDTAVKSFQKANGCTVDGEITAQKGTWKALLGLK